MQPGDYGLFILSENTEFLGLNLCTALSYSCNVRWNIRQQWKSYGRAKKNNRGIFDESIATIYTCLTQRSGPQSTGLHKGGTTHQICLDGNSEVGQTARHIIILCVRKSALLKYYLKFCTFNTSIQSDLTFKLIFS